MSIKRIASTTYPLLARYFSAYSDLTLVLIEQVLPTDRASVLLMAQRRRVEELESFTNSQVALLQSLMPAPAEVVVDEEGVPPAPET